MEKTVGDILLKAALQMMVQGESLLLIAPNGSSILLRAEEVYESSESLRGLHADIAIIDEEHLGT